MAVLHTTLTCWLQPQWAGKHRATTKQDLGSLVLAVVLPDDSLGQVPFKLDAGEIAKLAESAEAGDERVVCSSAL